MGLTDEQTAEPQTKLEVTEMNHKKLTINIEVITALEKHYIKEKKTFRIILFDIHFHKDIQ